MHILHTVTLHFNPYCRWQKTSSKPAVVNATVAGTVASWYFLSPNVPPAPTKRSLNRALTTSFGSLCLGSLALISGEVLKGAAKRLAGR